MCFNNRIDDLLQENQDGEINRRIFEDIEEAMNNNEETLRSVARTYCLAKRHFDENWKGRPTHHGYPNSKSMVELTNKAMDNMKESFADVYASNNGVSFAEGRSKAAEVCNDVINEFA